MTLIILIIILGCKLPLSQVQELGHREVKSVSVNTLGGRPRTQAFLDYITLTSNLLLE